MSSTPCSGHRSGCRQATPGDRRDVEPRRAGEAYCPACGARGRPVAATTVRSLAPGAWEPSRTSGFLFCATPGCDTVYFDPAVGERICRAGVRVPVFEKETSPARLVCYC